MKTWQLQTAKARLSRLIQNAIMNGPQQITVHGVTKVIVINKSEYDRLTQKKVGFVEFIRQSPLTEFTVKLKRDKSLTRDIDL